MTAFAPLRLILILAALLLTALPAAAQDLIPQPGKTDQPAETAPTPVPPPVDERFNCPLATMQTFQSEIARIEAGNLSAAAQAEAIGRIAKALDVDVDNKERLRELAASLTVIFNKLGSMSRSQLPDEREVERLDLAAFTYFPLAPGRFPRLPGERGILRAFPEGRIELMKTPDGEWIFSLDTVTSVPDFAEAIRDLPDASATATDVSKISRSFWLEELLHRYGFGTLVSNRFLRVKLWKWLAIGVIALIGVFVDLMIRFILSRFWLRASKRREVEVNRANLRRAVRPFGMFFAALVWLVGIRLFGLPDTVMIALTVAIQTILSVTGVLAAYRVADVVGDYFAEKAARTPTKIDDLLVPLLRKTVKIVITAIGIVYIADALRVPVFPLLSGLGIGGIAVAIAAKDSIENFFGSVAVILDRPFEVGDWVEIGDVEGTVEELGFRSTRIRTFYNSVVTVPNAALVRANVDNFGRRRYRRIKTHLSVTYDTTPDKIEAFCEGIRELIRLHPYTRKDYYQVWLHQFSTSSLDILVYCFHEAPDWQTELRERQRLYLDILRLAHKLGVEFAFPTQTMYLRREEYEAVNLASSAVAPEGIEHAAQETGRDVARQVTGNADWREVKPPPYAFSTWGGASEGRGSAGDAAD